MAGTARQSYGLVYQLLEGTYFLGIGPSWVLIHQIPSVAVARTPSGIDAYAETALFLLY